MKLATLKSDRRDGRLVVVSRDLTRAVDASTVAPTLLDALERWSEAAPRLRDLAERLDEGRAPAAFDFDPTTRRRRCLAHLNGATARRSSTTAS